MSDNHHFCSTNYSCIIQKLYNKYTQFFKLPEASLAVLSCTGFEDRILIDKLWIAIIDAEITDGGPTRLMRKIQELGGLYYPSDRYFNIRMFSMSPKNYVCWEWYKTK